NATAAHTGFVRNLDTLDADAMGEQRLQHARFPLGTGSAQASSGCATYAELPGAPTPGRTRMLAIAERIGASALNEWHCLNGSEVDGVDVIEALPIQGLLALDADDGELLYQRGSTLVWTPRHAVRTYGHPGTVASMHRLGVPIALGTMWQPT